MLISFGIDLILNTILFLRLFISGHVKMLYVNNQIIRRFLNRPQKQIW